MRKISVIIPVYNEILINECLKNLVGADETIVVDGNGTSTLDLIESLHVKKISSQKGRANQMNEGAKYATSEVLLFLHVDTILPLDALLHVKEALKQKDVVAGAFDLDFDTQKSGLKFIAKIASWRSRTTRLPYGDQAIFIKKDVFESIGGYEDIALMEDVNLMQKLKKQKLKIEIINQKVITSPRRYEKNGILFNLLKNWVLISLYFVGVNPDKLAKFYK
jgi:rSAM/selenodomain-associated transferase 2